MMTAATLHGNRDGVGDGHARKRVEANSRELLVLLERSDFEGLFVRIDPLLLCLLRRLPYEQVG